VRLLVFSSICARCRSVCCLVFESREWIQNWKLWSRNFTRGNWGGLANSGSLSFHSPCSNSNSIMRMCASVLWTTWLQNRAVQRAEFFAINYLQVRNLSRAMLISQLLNNRSRKNCQFFPIIITCYHYRESEKSKEVVFDSQNNWKYSFTDWFFFV